MEQLQQRNNRENERSDELGADILAPVNLPLAEKGRRQISEKLTHTLSVLRANSTAGEKSPDSLKLAEKQLEEISIELTGENLEILNLRAFEKKTMESLRVLLDNGANLKALASAASAIDSDEAWEFRRELRERQIQKGKSVDELMLPIYEGLCGMESEQAWAFRDALIESAVPLYSAQSIAGLDSARSWETRELFTGEADDIALSYSLSAVDSPRAWEKRKQNLGTVNPVFLHKSLIGLDSEAAWEMRSDLKPKVSRAGFIAGLISLDSERAWQARHQSIIDGGSEITVLRSVTGVDSHEAWEIRNRFLKSHLGDVLESLAGIDSERAWELRMQHLNTKDDNMETHVAWSFNGPYNTTIAWRAAKGLLPYQIEQNNQKIKT